MSQLASCKHDHHLAAAFRSSALLLRCASAIRDLASALNVFRPTRDVSVVDCPRIAVIQAGGLPRRFPCPEAVRSSAINGFFDLFAIRHGVRKASCGCPFESRTDSALNAEAFIDLHHAERAAKSGDKAGVMAFLKKAGIWALDVAKSVGADVATTAVKAALGLN